MFKIFIIPQKILLCNFFLGKSSLISSMLGEIGKVSGTVNTDGTIAIVAQQAWIQNATLQVR